MLLMGNLSQLFDIIKTIGIDIKDDIKDDIFDGVNNIKTTFTQPFNLFKNEELDDASVQAGLLLNNENVCFEQIPKIIDTIQLIHEPLRISEGLMHDSGLEDWALQSSYTKGGGQLLWKLIQNPTSDIQLLEIRQKLLQNIIGPNEETIKNQLKILKETEKDILWLFTVPELKDAYPINLLFPSIMGVKLINHVPIALDLFQFYRSNILPWLSIVFPLSTFLGPWWYMRSKLGFRLSFKRYCRMVFSAIKFGLKPDGNIIKTTLSYFSLFMYVFFYVYGIIQGFQASQMLCRMQKTLTHKLANIRKFVNAITHVLKSCVVPESLIHCFDTSLLIPNLDHQLIPIGMCGLYKIIKDTKTKEVLKLLCNYAWMIDSCVSMYNCVSVHKCCFTQYIYDDSRQTQFYNMGHITLSNSQVKNPASLEKSLIITGPNAAGKTTYVRAIFTNIILSQSLGIACATRAYVVPVHALGTFMRISDSLGTSSLFEAEVKRCAELINQAEEISAQGKKAIYFLDEPMHSTPPIEGSATSKAVITYIGSISNVRILVTTHYHDLVSMNPKLFKNVSMDAIETNDKTYIFPYKIQSGPSFKCIALELLEANKLPSSIVEEAIKIKNIYINKLA